MPPRLAHEALDGRGRGRIDHRHGREIDHIGLRMFADAVERGGHVGGGAEKERARDAVHDDIAVGRERRIVGLSAPCRRRDRPARRRRDQACPARPRRSAPCGAGTSSVADAEADQDALGQIAEHHQQERRQQHHGVAARGAEQRRELMLLRHVPGHHRTARRPARPAECKPPAARRRARTATGTARCSMPATGRARRRAHWSPSARSCRSRRCRRTGPRRYWRRPAPPVRRSSGGGVRSCCRRRPPTAGFRYCRAARTTAPPAAFPGFCRARRSANAAAGQRTRDAAEAAADGFDVQAERPGDDARRARPRSDRPASAAASAAPRRSRRSRAPQPRRPQR